MNTPQLIRSFIASVALEGGRLVKLSGGQLVYCGAGEQPLGVLETTAAAGESADVLMAGFGKIQVAAALAVNTQLASDANGRAVAAVAGNYVVGRLYSAGKAPVSSTYDRADVIVPPVFHQIPTP